MRLRVLVSDGDDWRDVVARHGPTHTVGDLTRAIAEHIGHTGGARLLVGQPPRTGPEASSLVVESGLRWGDRLTLGSTTGDVTTVPEVPLRRLVAVGGPDAGRTLELRQGTYVVGRAEDVDVTVRDPHLSRRHLRITVDADGVTVADLASSNGTRIDGVDVATTPVTVTNRSLLVAGATVFRLRPPRPRSASPPVREGLVRFRPRPRATPSPTVVYDTGGGLLGAALRRRRQQSHAVVDDVAGRRAAHPDPRALIDSAAQVERPLWERRAGDPDLLDLRIGWRLSVPGDGGADPLVFSLREHAVVAVACEDEDLRRGLVRWMLLQVAGLCSPVDVGIVVSGDDEGAWEWTAWLPHTRLDPDSTPEHVVVVTDDVTAEAPASVEALVAGRGTQLHRLVLSGDADAHARGTTTITIDADDGTVVVSPRPRLHGHGVEAVRADVALELALLLSGIRPVAQLAGHDPTPEPARLLELLGGGTPDAGWIRGRWSARDVLPAPIGTIVDGTLTLPPALGHVVIEARDGPSRDATLRTVVASLATTRSPSRFQILLVSDGDTLDGIARLPHVVGPSLQPHAAASWLGAELARRAGDEDAASRRLLVVTSDAEHPELRSTVDAILDERHQGVHLVLATASTAHDAAAADRALRLVMDTGGGAAGRLTGTARRTDEPQRFTLASLAETVAAPSVTPEIAVHDVVGGRIVEDSRTSTHPPSPDHDTASDLERLVAACAAAAREHGSVEVDAPRAVERTFLFTDVVRSTALVEAIGDDHWTRLLQWHDDALVDVVNRHGGDVVDHTGDGFFVVFEQPAAALGCALAIQRMLRAHRTEAGFAPEVRIGLHHAEARYDGRYRGRGVHVAARIASLAGGGEVLASLATIEGVDGIEVEAERTEQLRGISTPVPVARVRVD